MQVEYINPFITSVRNAFVTMLDCEPRRGEVCLLDENSPRYPISGVIGLSGGAVGTVVLGLSKEVALKAASIMLMEELTKINEDVLDAVGELTNVIAGRAKSDLEQYDLTVSLPNVITGEGHSIHFPSNVTPICLPFETDWGSFSVDIGFVPVNELVSS